MKAFLKPLIPERYRPYTYLKQLVDRSTRDGVVAGPFKGMRYVREAVCGALYPKLLGTYESELQPVVHSILNKHFRTIIDIGAAEGYYACGFGRQIPEAQVIAFEADLRGRYLLAQNISLNGLDDRIKVRGFCDAETLCRQLEAIEGPTLVICDAEGYEYDLLSPATVKGLVSCHILVEVHEFMLVGVTELLKHRFAGTHDVLEVRARNRTKQDFPIAPTDPYVKHAPFRYLEFFLSEKRPVGMNWLWMTPRDGTRGTPPNRPLAEHIS